MLACAREGVQHTLRTLWHRPTPGPYFRSPPQQFAQPKYVHAHKQDPLSAYAPPERKDCTGADVAAGAYNAIECATECSARSECTFFVLNGAKNFCWMKKNLGYCGSNPDRHLYLKNP